MNRFKQYIEREYSFNFIINYTYIYTYLCLFKNPERNMQSF